MNLEKLYQEMLEEKPYEVFLEPRLQIPTDLIEIQGNDIFKEFIKAKRRKSRTQMLLYMFYLGEILENDENPNRDFKRHKYVSLYYFKVAIKTYQLFRYVGPEQIYRTKNITITHISNLHVDKIKNAAEHVALQVYSQLFQPEVENQGEESVTLEENDSS
jgi:hypothetical protein